ncbi:MAG: hypothetical protein LWW82_12960 [Comamonadaceae bacterium]|nr:hypothetical protein [Comamonadaceae bacterium]
MLTGEGCSGPCELFAAWLQSSQRADIVATHPTAGALGQTMRVHLPSGLSVQLPLLEETGPATQDPAARLQGRGLAPRLRVPVNTDFIASVQAGGDPVLDTAVLRLDQVRTPGARR